MADREMVAATLAAALLTARGVGPHTDPAGYAVMVYRQVLNALDGAGPGPAQRPGQAPTP